MKLAAQTLWLMLLSAPAFGRDGLPFRIVLTPEEEAAEAQETVEVHRSKKAKAEKTPRVSPATSRPEKAAGEAKRAARRAPTDARRPLKGTGAEASQETRWGVVETVTPREAAEERGAVGGTEIELPRTVRFLFDSVGLTPNGKDALMAIADRLQATPELRLVLIEGHADQTGGARYNQRLSEARASAIREALIKRGVAPERLLAYGFGEARPNSPRLAKNRRVVFRLVEGDRDALERRGATQWGQVAVVGLQGEARFAPSPESDAPEQPGDKPPELEWTALAFKAQLGEGVDIDTQGAQVLLRLPDLGRVSLAPHTRIRLGKLFFDSADRKAYTAIKVREGQLTLMANPLGTPASRTLLSWEGGALEVTSADLELVITPAGPSLLSLDRGQAEVSRGSAQSQTVAGGQHLVLGGEPADPVARLAAPLVKDPPSDLKPSQRLPFLPVEGAARYRLEVALDVDFHQQVAVQELADAESVPVGLPAGPAFWRIRALSAEGTPGMPSARYAVTIAEGSEPTALAGR